MKIRPNIKSYHLAVPIIQKAQKTFFSPHEFYQICQQFKQEKKTGKLYFVLDDSLELPSELLFNFFDDLAEKIKKYPEKNLNQVFYLYKVLIKSKNQTFHRVKANVKLYQSWTQNPIKLSLETVGEGMIGRVAKIRINDGEDLALKVFFDSSLVWQHGPWAEIPAAIYLQAHHVTKNIPEFKFAGENWAVWEWIYPETKPELRSGITYEEFAHQKGLTPLNYLNRQNYNPHQIRLDLGGLQKEYPGRRYHDFFLSIIFYIRKFRQEGFIFLKDYLTLKNMTYFSVRLIVLFFSFLNRQKLSKDLEANGHF